MDSVPATRSAVSHSVRTDRSVRPSVVLWLIGNRLTLFLLVFLALSLFPHLLVPGACVTNPQHPIFDGWIRWDAGWYHQIASTGYDNLPNGEGQRDTAFFPLFPLLTHVLGRVIGHFGIAGLLVANLSGLWACVLLFRLTGRRFGTAVAERTLLLLLFFPYSFYLSSMHTEPLFLCWVVLAFYCADKRQWLRAALSAACASATRSVGVLVTLGLLVAYLESIEYDLRRMRADVLYLLLCPLGLMGYMLFLWKRFGTPLQFVYSQVAHGWAGSAFVKHPGTESTWTHSLLSWFLRLQFGHLLALGTITLLVTMRRRLPLSFVLWAVVTLCVSMSSPGSLGRFLIVVFPAFIALALLPWPRKVWIAVLTLSGALLAMNAVKQSLGQWVAG